MAQKGHVPYMIIPRATFKDGHLGVIRYVFNNVSTWELNCRYFSPVFIVNGYEWYFFLKSKLLSPLNQPEDMMETDNIQDNYTLGLFLRCNSKYMPNHHYLPLGITASILLKSSSERKFKFNVIFESPEKAIGGQITEPEETWPNIISGKSQIVWNNSITITFYLEFFEQSDNCQLIE